MLSEPELGGGQPVHEGWCCQCGVSENEQMIMWEGQESSSYNPLQYIGAQVE